MNGEKHLNSSPTDAPKPVTNPQRLNNDDQVRSFLAKSILGLMYLEAVTYIFIRDAVVLGTTTFVGVAAIFLFRYYFTRQ